MHDDNFLDTADRWVLDWLWQPERPSRGLAGAGMFTLQVVYLSVRSFFGRRLSFMAGALTFITLLGLVPALAISFALAKGLGLADSLRTLLMSEYTQGQHEVMEYILEYVDRTNVGALGAAGFAMLVVSLILALSNAEQSFNMIWEVDHTRTIFRKFTDYISVLIISPLLILAGTGMWAGMASHDLVQWLMNQAVIGDVAHFGLRMGPTLLLAAGFAFMYMFLPNTKVPLVSAAIAGLVASALWWMVQNAYIAFQVGVAKYNAIYGGFASLPLFLVWLHVSWTVVLFGAELAHTDYMCRNDLIPEAVLPPLSPAKRQAAAMELMLIVARRFHQGQAPLPINALANKLGVARNQAAVAAQALIGAGLLTQIDENDTTMPARDLSGISLRELATAVGAGLQPGVDETSGDPALHHLLARVSETLDQSLGGATVLDLVLHPGDDTKPSPPANHS